MRIGLFENHRAVEALHRGKIGFRKYMRLKIYDHVTFTSNRPHTSYKPYKALALSSRILFTTDVGTAPSSRNLRKARISEEVSLWP